MRRRMIGRGLQGTDLMIRGDGGKTKGKKADKDSDRKISGQKLEEMVKLLADVERTVAVLNRRGIHFTEFIAKHYDGEKLPHYMIRRQGQEEPEIFYDTAAYERRMDQLGASKNGKNGNGGEKSNGNGNSNGDEEPTVVGEELREVTRIEQINQKLRVDFTLDLKDFLLKAEKSDSGESLPTKFVLVRGDDTYEIASLGDICPAIRQIGGKGIDIKRFKGLGEMNAEQLWDTTMNPQTRMLLNVRLDDAGEADRLFTVLMGDDVEGRRRYIQDHALEVQNLDV
jgi:DNA gyrase subunit B